MRGHGTRQGQGRSCYSKSETKGWIAETDARRQQSTLSTNGDVRMVVVEKKTYEQAKQSKAMENVVVQTDARVLPFHNP